MTRIFLRALNAPAFILLVAIGVAIQTSLFNSWPLMYFQPDMVLLAVIWCALRRNFYEGGFLTLLFANIAEIHSSVPQGLFLIAYLVVYFLVRVANKLLVIPNLSSVVILTLASSVAWKLLNLLVLYMMDLAGHQWKHTLALLLPGSVMEGIAAIWVYQWLDRFDWVTLKTERARKQLEDELEFETNEGF